MNDQISNALRSMNHSQLYDLWLRAKNNEVLEGEEAVMARAMKEHLEYFTAWERLQDVNQSEIIVDGVNPIMHISMHSVVENQLEQNDPSEVRKALDALLKRGTSRHEAIHAIAYEFNMELFPVLKHSRPFNNNAYKRRLQKITRAKR